MKKNMKKNYKEIKTNFYLKDGRTIWFKFRIEVVPPQGMFHRIVGYFSLAVTEVRLRFLGSCKIQPYKLVLGFVLPSFFL